MSWSRLSGIAAVTWGAILLTRGPELWLAVDGREPNDVDTMAVRSLGMRHLTQGAVQTGWPGRFRGFFVAVDVVHAGSMFWLAAVDERRRRPALVSGAAALATAGLSVAGSGAR